MADETPRSRTLSAAHGAWTTAHHLVRGLSLTRVQTLVATLAGIASISGAALSAVEFARGGSTGELVAIVQAAGSHRVVTDATVEILTTQDALVATLTPDASGQARQQLTEGIYVVRVRPPRH